MAIEDIFNLIRIDEQTLTAGQPTEDQLQSVAEAGFQAVINLATIDPRYSLEDEAASCEALGMSYTHIPVEWDNPQPADYVEFKQAMESLEAQKVLIHCAANYRVTAFYSVYAKQALGWSDQQAMDLRKQIWESNPEYYMSEPWTALLETIDTG
jgi:uncharacterized protein (TIGR01244 family)